MSQDITLEDVQKKQEEMTALVRQLQEPGLSAERVEDLGRRLQADGEELGKMARAFEAQERGKSQPQSRGVLQVALTQAQRDRIRGETGIDLPVLQIEDTTGVVNQAMPMTDPRRIEALALAEARRRKTAAEARVKAREQLTALLESIERQGGAVKEKLDELRRDPTFLGGALKEE